MESLENLEQVPQTEEGLREYPDAETGSQPLEYERFCEQLTQEKVLTFPDLEQNTTYLMRYTEIAPEGPPRGEPVLYIGGFGTSAPVYTEQLYALAKRGKRVVFVNPMHGIPPTPDLQKFAEDTSMPPLMASKAAEVLFIKNSLGLGKVDILGHSQGGAVGALVAAYEPGAVDQLLLDTPAGLVGEMSRAKLIARAVDELIVERQFAQSKAQAGDTSYAESLARNTHANTATEELLWRLREEIPAIGNTDITPLLRKIRRDNADAQVALLTANNDRLFQAHEIEQTMGVHEGEGFDDTLFTTWVMYADKEVAHGAATHHDPALVSALEGQGERASLPVDLIVERDRAKRAGARS